MIFGEVINLSHKRISVEVKSDEEVFNEIKKFVKDIKAGKKVKKKESIVFSTHKGLHSFLADSKRKKQAKALKKLLKISKKGKTLGIGTFNREEAYR
ncbi:MAG: hypothetical protein HY392_04090 [Candidatus Diapherotrites archaeon]|nr:hypothetical protein [Candidatus Diapherotrites archaeon]